MTSSRRGFLLRSAGVTLAATAAASVSRAALAGLDRKSTRLNSSHSS